jgi:heme-binding NEAT domain protein
MFDVDGPKAMTDTLGLHNTKKDVEVQDIHSTSMKTASLSPVKGDDDEELGGTEVEQNKGEVTSSRDKEDPSKKRNITPPNPSSRNKSKATGTTLKTTLTPYDFDLLIVALNDVSLELTKNQEAKKEDLFHWITKELKEVQQALRPAKQFLWCP